MVQNAVYDHTVQLGRVRHAPPTAPLIALTSTTPADRRARQPRAGPGRDPPRPARGAAAHQQRREHRPRLLLPRRKLGAADRRATRGALPDRAVIRRRGRRGDTRQRQGRLHPALVHPRPRVVLGHPRAHRRVPRRRPDRGPHRSAGCSTASRRAERRAVAGDEVAAIVHLKQLAGWAHRGIRRDTAARDAVLRPTQALVALLWAAKAHGAPRRRPSLKPRGAALGGARTRPRPPGCPVKVA